MAGAPEPFGIVEQSVAQALEARCSCSASAGKMAVAFLRRACRGNSAQCSIGTAPPGYDAGKPPQTVSAHVPRLHS